VAAVLAHHPNGILITDERGVVKVLNGSASRLLYTTFDKAVGRSLVELTNDSDLEELVRVATQMPNQYHTVDTMVNGHILEVGATFVTVSSGKYSGLITLQDVTELRKLQHIQQSSMVAVTR
jgi:signal transduction histidine kinase